MAYLDTSIILPYYCPEKLSVKAEKIILQDDAPAISTLTAVEFASALSRKIREKTLSVGDAKSIIERFESHRKNGCYKVRSIVDRHYELAASFILKFENSLRSLDALHLAVAREMSTTIVTGDRLLAVSAGKLGVTCLLVS